MVACLVLPGILQIVALILGIVSRKELLGKIAVVTSALLLLAPAVLFGVIRTHRRQAMRDELDRLEKAARGIHQLGRRELREPTPVEEETAPDWTLSPHSVEVDDIGGF